MDSEIFFNLIGVACLVVVMGIVYIIWSVFANRNRLRRYFPPKSSDRRPRPTSSDRISPVVETISEKGV
jgi:hypothetical protein